MQQAQTDDLGFCPSFSCYSSDSLASTAAARISTQLLQDHDEFEFSVLDEEIKESENRTDFPLFNRDLAIRKEVIDREDLQRKADEEEIASSSSDESDGGVFCVWRFKTDGGSSSPLSKCKKSGSTGSGSKRWRIRDLLRRSNSEGKDRPVMMLTERKKVEVPKRIVAGKSETKSETKLEAKSKAVSPSIHELFYLRRAKGEGGKRKSYLPYRQGLVGFFSNVNGPF